jgi:hypothetical protein
MMLPSGSVTEIIWCEALPLASVAEDGALEGDLLAGELRGRLVEVRGW